MKKIFTLASMALVAMSMNAQNSWSVANEDGTLKAEYVANEDASAMSVVSFKTENVTGTHTSGPVAGYKDATTLPLEENVDNTWGTIQTKALSADGSVAPFYYVQGKGNPVNLDKVTFEEVVTDGTPTGMYRPNWDDSYYSPDGVNGLPTNGTYVTLTPEVAGIMKVAVWINKGRRAVFVVKKSDMKALALGTEVKASGYINGQNWQDTQEGEPLHGYVRFIEDIEPNGTEGDLPYVVGSDDYNVANQAAWVYLTFNAVANETYYIFNKNTQIGFSGFEFTPSGETGISEIKTANDANAPVYNLAGQRVSNDAKGLLIKNGKKFINK